MRLEAEYGPHMPRFLQKIGQLERLMSLQIAALLVAQAPAPLFSEGDGAVPEFCPRIVHHPRSGRHPKVARQTRSACSERGVRLGTSGSH
jgi:hypothetical protein